MRIILFSCLLFLSCNKGGYSNRTTEPPKDPLGLSTKLMGSWKLSAESSNPAYDADGNGTLETNLFAIYDACRKDAGFNFSNNGKGSIRQNCSLNWSMNWEIKNNSTELHYNFSTNGGSTYGSFLETKIIELTNSILKISFVTQPPNGQFYTITSTYTKL